MRQIIFKELLKKNQSFYLQNFLDLMLIKSNLRLSYASEWCSTKD
jgi:hypothetical protein